MKSAKGPEAGVWVIAETSSLPTRLIKIVATDDQGYARFDVGLTQGVGAAAPALVVVRDGAADVAFLSLNDPEFDLSDRGVEGREAAPLLLEPSPTVDLSCGAASAASHHAKGIYQQPPRPPAGRTRQYSGRTLMRPFWRDYGESAVRAALSPLRPAGVSSARAPAAKACVSSFRLSA